MKILDRYVLLSFLKNYLISFMVLVGLYILLDLVINFDELIEAPTRAGSSGLSSFITVLGVIWEYYFYQTFLIYAQLSGVIAVVAAAFTLVRLSRFNELAAILAAGVPLMRIAAPIIIASLVLNVLLLVDQELIIPRLVPKLVREHDDVGRGTTRAYDIKAMQDDRNSLIFAGRYTPPADGAPAKMIEIDIIEHDEHLTPIAHLTAESATWDEVGRRWKLVRGQRVTGLRPNERRSPVQRVNEYKSDVSPEEISLYRSSDNIDLLSTARINELLARPQSFGTIDLLRVKHARFTQWFMNLVAVLLGIACILTREPGRLKSDGIRLLFTVAGAMAAVFLCHQIAGHPPAGAAWADRWPALMAWLPIFIFLPLAIFLLDRMHTKRS